MNSKVSIGEIFSQAINIIWKFKVLWLIGMLATCGVSLYMGFTYSFNTLFMASMNSFSSGPYARPPQFLQPYAHMRPEIALQEFLAAYGLWIAAGVLLGFVFLLISYYLSLTGRAALIKGINQADNLQPTSLPKFGALWSQGRPYVWRMFLMDWLLGLPAMLVLTIVFGGFMGLLFAAGPNSQGGGAAAVFFGAMSFLMCGMFIFWIFATLIMMIGRQAYNAIVLEDLGVLAAFSRGWQVFKSAWLSIVLVSLIAGVIISISSTVIIIPVQVLTMFSAMSSAFDSGMLVPVLISAGSLLIYVPLFLLFYSLILVFNQAVWTVVYRRLTVEPAKPVVAAPDTEPDVESLR